MTTPTILTAKGLAEIQALREEHLRIVEGRMDLREEVMMLIAHAIAERGGASLCADAAIALVVERCAQVVDQGQETWSNASGEDEASIGPRKHGNLTGLAYAAAIRALSPQPGAAA